MRSSIIFPISLLYVQSIMKLLFFVFIISLYSQLSADPKQPPSLVEPWGIDASLCRPQPKQPSSQLSKGQKSCRSLIRFFQNHISPIDGPRSTFYPTSSQYALEAICKYGVFKGIALGCDRLMRENKEAWIYDITDAYGCDRKVDPVR